MAGLVFGKRIQSRPRGPAAEEDEGHSNSENPLTYTELVEKICDYLPVEDVKKARLLNHFWLEASTTPWTSKTQLKFEDMQDLKQFLTMTANMRVVRPFTITNWTFQGDTVMRLMGNDGICEQHLLNPFWTSMANVTFSNWMRKRYREEVTEITPGQVNIQEVPYYIPLKSYSAPYVTDMLKKVCSNLNQLVIHYPLLSEMTGTQIGPRQFPELEMLTRFEIYFEGTKWLTEMGSDPYQLLRTNMTKSDADLKLPEPMSGGNTLIRRILDHSPNLTHITATTGTTMTYKLETWFLCHLFSKTVILTKVIDLHCSIPLHVDVCNDLKSRPWPLKALHLRTLPTYSIPAKSLYSMISSFADTLRHLELIFIGKGNHSFQFLGAVSLYNLESLELWGFTGEYGFLKEFKKLKNAVIGVTEAESYVQMKEYFKNFSLPQLKLELKTVADFYTRLDQGPLTPFKIC